MPRTVFRFENGAAQFVDVQKRISPAVFGQAREEGLEVV
jgi:hypothetical protein